MAWRGVLCATLAIGMLCSCITSIPEIMIEPNLSMPMMAFGTTPQSFDECGGVHHAVEHWLRSGGRHIDSATLYTNELNVQKGIKASGIPRDKIFLTTKVPSPMGYQPTIDLIKYYEMPLMGVDYFDLVLIHFECPIQHAHPWGTMQGWPFPNTFYECGTKYKQDRLDTFAALRSLKNEGKIGAYGVSNFNELHLREALDAGFKPVVNQIQWHLGWHNDTFLAIMNSLGVRMEAWSALSGNITGAWDTVPLTDARLLKVATKYGASPAQIALQWSIHKGAIPVISSCKKAHMIEDMSAFDLQMSDEDIAFLDSLAPQATQKVFM